MRDRAPTRERVVAHVLFEPRPEPVGVRPHSLEYYDATTPTPETARQAVELLTAARFEVVSQTPYSATVVATPKTFEDRLAARLRIVDGYWDWLVPPTLPEGWSGFVRGVVLPTPVEALG